MSKQKLFQSSLKWVQSRRSSFIRLDAVQHWSWHVVLDMTKNFIFGQSDFWPPCTVFNAVAKRIELEQWDWSYVEALSKGFHYLFYFFIYTNTLLWNESRNTAPFFLTRRLSVYDFGQSIITREFLWFLGFFFSAAWNPFSHSFRAVLNSHAKGLTSWVEMGFSWLACVFACFFIHARQHYL